MVKLYSFRDIIYFHIRAELFVAAAFVALVLSCPLHAESCEVIIVKSAELKPYQEVLRGFTSVVGCKVRELKLREDEGAETILRESPDIVFAIGTNVFKKVKAIKDKPVIFTMVIPSEVAGMQQSNISGVSMDISPEVYIATMKKVFPTAKRIGLLYDPRQTAAFVQEAQKASRTADIELIIKQTRDPREIPGLMDEMRGKIDVLWMVPDPTVITTETVDYLIRFSFQYNIPIFSFSKKYVEMGAVASLDMDLYDMGVQAGELANEISTGSESSIRVYARTAHLAINSAVAAKMGLRINDKTVKSAIKIE